MCIELNSIWLWSLACDHKPDLRMIVDCLLVRYVLAYPPMSLFFEDGCFFWLCPHLCASFFEWMLLGYTLFPILFFTSLPPLFNYLFQTNIHTQIHFFLGDRHDKKKHWVNVIITYCNTKLLHFFLLLNDHTILHNYNNQHDDNFCDSHLKLFTTDVDTKYYCP